MQNNKEDVLFLAFELSLLLFSSQEKRRFEYLYLDYHALQKAFKKI